MLYEEFVDREVVTTAWVLTELADAMCAPAKRGLSALLLRRLRLSKTVRIIGADDALFWRGLEFYERRSDKEWSLTDCISFVVMSEEGLTEALTADRHFQQAGFTALMLADL